MHVEILRKFHIIDILRNLHIKVSYNETHIKHMYITMTLCNQNQSQKFIAFVHDISSVNSFIDTMTWSGILPLLLFLDESLLLILQLFFEEGGLHDGLCVGDQLLGAGDSRHQRGSYSGCTSGL